MATTIITKNGSGAPAAGNLTEGELALDLTNKKLYSKEGSTVFEVGATGGGASGTFTDLTATSSFTSPGIDDNATSTAITIDSSENVGIGGSATYSLTVDDALGFYGGTGVGTLSAMPAHDLKLLARSGQDLTLAAGGSDAMTISSTGNVGIGESNPSAKLEVFGDVHVTGSGGTKLLVENTAPKITLRDTSAVGAEADEFIIRSTSGQSSGDYEFVINNDLTSSTDQVAMKFSGGGNVGIGTDAPATLLHVKSTAGDTLKLEAAYSTIGPNIVFSNTGGNLARIASAETNTLRFEIGPTNTEAVRIDASGNLLVGKTSTSVGITGCVIGGPTSAGSIFATSNNGLAIFNRANSTASAVIELRLSNVDAGKIIGNTGGLPSFGAASDERLKDNITDHESELANVMALRPTRWYWKDETLGTGEGFIAQELEQTAWSDLVSEGDDGFKQVAGLGAVETRLIKAIQEQQAMIETLQAEVAALKGAN